MMEVDQLNANQYAQVFRKYSNIFSTPLFAQLNESAFDDIKYLHFHVENKSKAGIILGKRNNTYYAPTLAPFSGITKINDTSHESVDCVIKLLSTLAKQDAADISIVIPPLIYDSEFDNLVINSFFRSEFKIEAVDINYHIIVEKTQEEYVEALMRNGRKNLKAGLKNNITLIKDNSEEHIIEAYNIIQQNRLAKGYPLRMSLEKVLQTIQVVPADFFILKINESACAAAQVFHVSDGIVQVIYWGDLPGNEYLRPMNVLAYKLHEYYMQNNIRIIDIGPSTENSVPNFGLCSFKKSIGCKTSLKYKFIYNNGGN